MALPRTQLLNVNGPAPTGLALNWSAPLEMAVGDPIQPSGTTELGNTPLLAFNVIFRVVASTTSICWTEVRNDAFDALVAGSAVRTQLNLMAAASYAVPSLNLMLGRIFSVHTRPS